MEAITFFNNLLNKEKLKKELIFSSMFLMTYENTVYVWKDNILGLYAPNHYIEDGIMKHAFFEKSDEKRFMQEVCQTIKKKDGNYDKTLSIFNWLKINEFMMQQDYDDLIKIRKLRNDIAHKLIDTLGTGLPENAKTLFNRLIEIRKTVSSNWIMGIEIPTNPEFDDQDIKPEDVSNLLDSLFNLIIKQVID